MTREWTRGEKTYAKAALGSDSIRFSPNSCFFFKNSPAFGHDISSFRSLSAKPDRLLGSREDVFPRRRPQGREPLP